MLIEASERQASHPEVKVKIALWFNNNEPLGWSDVLDWNKHFLICYDYTFI